MQSIIRTARATTLGRTLLLSCAIPSTSSSSSRSFATNVDDDPLYAYKPKKLPKPPIGRDIPVVSDPKFIVKPKEIRPKVARYSKHSTRVLGRGRARESKGLKPNYGQVKIFLPSVFMRFVRNGGAHVDDPYTATFRCSLKLTKPDIANYLHNLYGLKITGIRTINYMSRLKQMRNSRAMSRRGGTKNYKKVIVTMKEPFWYPQEPSSDWLNEHYAAEEKAQIRIEQQKFSQALSQGRSKTRNFLEEAEEKDGYNSVYDKDESKGRRFKDKPVRFTLAQPGRFLPSEEKLVRAQRKVVKEMERLKEAGW